MTATKRLAATVVAAVVACVASVGTAGEQRFGEPIDAKAPKVTLAELLAKPDPYVGKDVVVDGHFAGKCCGADFFFKDKVDMIEVTPPGNGKQCMLLKAGTPIRLYGRVRAIQRAGAAPIVSIEGKAVEVREVSVKKNDGSGGRGR